MYSHVTLHCGNVIGDINLQFIEEIFRLASGNVTVNGVSYEEAFKVVDGEYQLSTFTLVHNVDISCI
jgi:hypothetical protein